MHQGQVVTGRDTETVEGGRLLELRKGLLVTPLLDQPSAVADVELIGGREAGID
jgi:hypothetical protein